MRIVTLLLTLVLLCAPVAVAEAIDDAEAERLVRDAAKIRDATLAGDWEVIVDMMHPRARDGLGGREAALERMRQIGQRMQEHQISFSDFLVAKPTEIFEAADEFVVFVPTTSYMAAPMGDLIVKEFLVASRPKDSETWVYVKSAGVRDRAMLETLFRGFPAEVRLPETSHEMVPKIDPAEMPADPAGQ